MTTTKIAIVGATGLVGQMIIKVLQERNIKGEFFLFASESSVGQVVEIFGEQYKVEGLTKKRVKEIKADFALFSAGNAISEKWVPEFVKAGGRVIDNSSKYRMYPDVPLVVPEINPGSIKKSKIIANPNCSTIGSVMALAPLDKLYKIKRVVYSTYQAISGAGSNPKFDYPIKNNVLPHIDILMTNNNTREEEKMINETKKILNRKDILVSSTAVRVPVRNCHSISINVEFYKKPNIEKIKQVLSAASGVIVYDYPVPTMVDGRDEVYVGRIRYDEDNPNTINLWTVSDNIRKGAATNAVQILELLI